MDEVKVKGNANEHLANERTYLAWLRTGIGIMAFGFVVVKFSLFLKQFAVLLPEQTRTKSQGYSSILGIALVTLGAVAVVLSYVRYKQTEKQLTQGYYKNSALLISVVTSLVVLV